MSVLNTLLDVASLSVEISMAQQLEAMQRQGMAAAMMKGIVNQLKDQIFKYSETSKNILAAETSYPLKAAGAMRLLEIRLDESGLSPDLFSELADKEYVSNTFRGVRENANRLTAQLSGDDRAQLEGMISKTARLPDYEYYVEHVERAKTYREAKKLAGKSGSKNLGLFSMLGCGLFTVSGMCITLSAISSASQVSGGASAALNAIVITGLAALGVWWGYNQYSIAGKSEDAKKRLIELDKQFSIERYEALETEFKDNLEEIKRLRDDGRVVANTFFGDLKLIS
jgi:hypothetical protein